MSGFSEEAVKAFIELYKETHNITLPEEVAEQEVRKMLTLEERQQQRVNQDL